VETLKNKFMERYCLDCQTSIRGRADKKFCDDQCRSNYNNHQKTINNQFLNSVNKILKKNRDILCAKNPEGKTKTTREVLLRKGFNFIYHTHTYATQNGHHYFFCYEYGYLPLANNELLLVKREEK
jgi:predicted nucleic acid-binding Zn ribbon protein